MPNQQQLLYIAIVAWDMTWKGISLWKAAKNNHQKWFIALLLLNTIGILPIIYIKFFQKPLNFNFKFDYKEYLPWKKHDHKH